MSESTNSASNVSLSSMIVLIFNKRRVIIPRPISYEAAVDSARKYFSEISLQSTVKFLCDGLDICKGQLAEIPEESWKEVINDISSLTINVSSREVFESPSPFPSTSSSTTLVRRRERRIRIEIHTICGKQFKLKVYPTAQVQRVADACRSKLGGGQYRLYHSGKMLEHHRLLLENQIEDGGVIHARQEMVGGKPVIYLFSPEEIEASVSLSLVQEWKISAIYPVVPVKTAVGGQGQKVVWHVQTKTNGDLTELNTGLDVSYLFWEAHTESVASIPSPPASPVFDESASRTLEYFNPTTPNLTVSNSVVLSTEKITPYLDKVLSALGLHTEARTSFITYWLPSLLKHKHIAFRFLPQAAYERAAPLNISPKPDIITRIFMLFKGVQDDELAYWEDAIKRASQDVRFWVSIVGVDDVEHANDSSLFRVLEWGGMEVLGVTELGIDALHWVDDPCFRSY